MTTTIARPETHKSYVDMERNEVRNLTLHNLAADPGTPVDGQILYRTDTDKVRVRVNGVWTDLATMADVTAGGISSAIVDAKGDLIVGSAPDTAIREAVGANGTVYIADSAQTGGHIWRTLTEIDVQVAVTDKLVGRDTVGGGACEEISVGGGIEFTGLQGIQTSAFTGNVTKAAGGTALTIPASTVTLAMQANLAANSIMGNNTAGAIAPLALTYAEVKTALAIVPGDIAGFDTQVRTSRLDQMAATTGPLSMNSQKITSLADGTVATDAATFGQLSNAIQGFDWKEPVRAATTANIANVLTGAPNILDGITLVVGERVLVKDQSTGGQNGIYTVTTVGTGANGVWARSTDMDVAGEADNATVLIEAGTVNLGSIYTQTATIATLGTTAMVWVKSSSSGAIYTADGTTITLSGQQFAVTAGGINATQLNAAVAGNGLAGGGGTALSVNVDAANMEISADAVRISATAAGNGLTGGGAAALAVGAGTGISVTADAVSIDTAVVTRKYATSIGNAALTTFTITHNLNTRDVVIAVYEASTFEVWEVDVAYTTVNTATVTFTGHVPTTNQFRVVVTG